jgi:hypothetical protein
MEAQALMGRHAAPVLVVLNCMSGQSEWDQKQEVDQATSLTQEQAEFPSSSPEQSAS